MLATITKLYNLFVTHYNSVKFIRVALVGVIPLLLQDKLIYFYITLKLLSLLTTSTKLEF